MTELDIMRHAKDYIDKLAQGIDPISGQEVPEDSVINQARLIRCFFYVSGVLQQVIDNGGQVNRGSKAPFQMTDEMYNCIIYSAEPVMIRKFMEPVNALADSKMMQKISLTKITGWLVEKGFLFVETDEKGHGHKLPTDAGKELGISSEYRPGKYGGYTAVLYNEDAQHFIIDHMEDILHPIEPDAV